MRKIRDFIYSYLDLVLVLLILAFISYTLVTNLNYLLNLSSNDIVMAKEEDNLDNQQISLNIPSGINQDQLADILIAYKLINNKNEFLSQVNKKGNVISINSGQINIDENSNIEEIINILINY